MKKIAPFLFLLPFAAWAQKEIKPSVSKAETALQKGIFDEAKSIIDATVNNQDYMVDKKGQPSKNAAKAWYLKGMIYAAIDTTKAEKYKQGYELKSDYDQKLRRFRTRWTKEKMTTKLTEHGFEISSYREITGIKNKLWMVFVVQKTR